MKLYAITTSERASKGQGGNEFLKIEVKNQEKATILVIEIKDSNLLIACANTWFKSIDSNVKTNQEISEVRMLGKAHELANNAIKANKKKDENKCGHPLCGKTICKEDVPL